MAAVDAVARVDGNLVRCVPGKDGYESAPAARLVSRAGIWLAGVRKLSATRLAARPR